MPPAASKTGVRLACGYGRLPGGAIDSAAAATTTCAAPQNDSRGSSFCPFIAACWPLPASLLSSSLQQRFAQGGPPAMPVTVAPPIAKRVTQWDEFSGPLRGGRLGRGARARLGLHRQAAFPRRPARQCRRPAVHHRQAAVRDRRRERRGRGRAQQGAGRPRRAAGPARRLADQPRAPSPTREYDQRKANLNVARAQLKAAEAALRNRPSSTSTGPTCARRWPAASPTARSMPAT